MHFLEAEVKNKDCCSSTCQSVLDSQASDLPSSLNSARLQSWAMYDSGMHKGPLHITFHPCQPHPYSLSWKPKHQRRCCCTSEPMPDICCVLPSNFSKHCCQWHKQVLAWEHAESEQEWRIYSEITKHFFKAPLLLCNNLLLPFFILLQINSRERLKTPQLTMRGGRKIPTAG